jgi:adenosylmethionine-8-amino-7-oxononanoate aminotransferase
MCGTILAFDLKVEDAGYASAVRKKILNFFFANGVLIRPLGNVIYLLPPYCISPEQLQFCYDKILEFLNTFESR